MAEFIERKALREAFENADADVVEDYGDGACDWGFGYKNILEVINSVPAADVAPVRHGRWEKAQDMRRMDGNIYDYRCSLCDSLAEKCVYNNYVRLTKYCPNCGAKMDLEVNNDA